MQNAWTIKHTTWIARFSNVSIEPVVFNSDESVNPILIELLCSADSKLSEPHISVKLGI